jgi:hypothetical protein
VVGGDEKCLLTINEAESPSKMPGNQKEFSVWPVRVARYPECNAGGFAVDNGMVE